MWTYQTTGNGWGVTLTAPDGRTVWLQDQDAVILLDALDLAWDDDCTQAVLSAYSDLLT